MNARHFATLIAFALTLGPAAAQPAPPGTDVEAWSQWRGPRRDGTVRGVGWPNSLDDLERIWRVELGEGYPGPIVTADRVFVVEAVDNEREVVLALDRATGRELWRQAWPATGKVPFFARKNGEWVRSTPIHDGAALYVGGIEEVLVKLDTETGEVRWQVDFPELFGTEPPDFGFASSPLIDGEALYVQAADSLVKLDRHTGETIWRSLESGGDMMASGAFSSPVIATLGGQRQLVVQTRYELHGIDLESGASLWSHDVPNFRGMNILTPVVHGDGVLTSSYRNRTYFYEVANVDDSWSVRERWSNKVHGYMSTPVVLDGHAYLHLGNGRLACLDLETGSERWVSKPFGDYWSMVTQGDKLLALDASGALRLLRHNPEAIEILGSRDIADQSTWGHLAIRGDEIFVRELRAIAAYRWTGAGGESGAR